MGIPDFTPSNTTIDWPDALCGFIVLGQGYGNSPENLSSHHSRIARTAPGDETRLPCNKEPHALQKIIALFALALGLAACGFTPEQEAIYHSLKANPPTSIPAADLAKLKKGHVACHGYNEGTSSEYMTCWLPAGRPTAAAQLYFYHRIISGGIYPSETWITHISL